MQPPTCQLAIPASAGANLRNRKQYTRPFEICNLQHRRNPVFFSVLLVRHRCFRPAMDETGVLLTFFVLLNLQFCFLLGHDIGCSGKTLSGWQEAAVWMARSVRARL